MKNYTQVYVQNSLEAVEHYCDAFGAEVTFEIKNPAQDAYEHCELSVKGEPFLAAAETPAPYDVGLIHREKWQVMTFNAFEMGSAEAVRHAFQVLSQGGVVIAPIGELPWSTCCATVIDRYGVCWWLSI
ncbi:VOC family protein [Oscillospiraceae bacterium 42-9]